MPCIAARCIRGRRDEAAPASPRAPPYGAAPERSALPTGNVVLERLTAASASASREGRAPRRADWGRGITADARRGGDRAPRLRRGTVRAVQRIIRRGSWPQFLEVGTTLGADIDIHGHRHDSSLARSITNDVPAAEHTASARRSAILAGILLESMLPMLKRWCTLNLGGADREMRGRQQPEHPAAPALAATHAARRFAPRWRGRDAGGSAPPPAVSRRPAVPPGRRRRR